MIISYYGLTGINFVIVIYIKFIIVLNTTLIKI